MKYEKPQWDILEISITDTIRTSLPEAGDTEIEDEVTWG